MGTPSKDGPTRRERAAAERRETILMAALACFLESGYHQTGVRDIAQRAGVSLGNVYNHFPSKHHILAEIAALERTEFAPLLQLLAEEGPAMDILNRFITAYSTYTADPDNIVLAIEITSEAIRQPDIGELFLANRNELLSALTSVIARGAREGEIRRSLDPATTAQSVLELMDGGAYRTVLSDAPLPDTIEGVRDFILAAVRR